MPIAAARHAADAYVAASAARNHLVRTLPETGAWGRAEAVGALVPVTHIAAGAFAEFLDAIVDLRSEGMFEAAIEVTLEVMDRTRGDVTWPIESEVATC